MKFNFKKTAAELFEKIGEKLAELFGSETEQEARRIEARRIQFVEESRYNDNMVRTVIPVLRSTQYALEHGNVNKQIAVQAVVDLEAKLDNVERQRQETLQVLNVALNSPNGKDYQLFFNYETRELLMFNNAYNEFNKNNPEATPKMPAVIAINGQTNEPYAYATFEEMFATNPQYQSLKNEGVSYLSKLNHISKNVLECEGNGTLVENTIAYINNRMDNVAQLLQNELDVTKRNANMNVIDKVSAVVEANTDCMVFNVETNQVILHTNENNAHLILNYSEDGLVDAYYKNAEGDACKVYDYRDASGGFIRIENDLDYFALTTSAEFGKVMSVEGNFVDYHKPMEYEYDKNAEIYIGTTYSQDMLGVTEPQNSVFVYRTCFSEELEQKMTALMQSYQKSVNSDVNVTYNPFNNTINLENNNKIVTIGFDEDGRRGDVTFHTKGELIKESDLIVSNTVILNHASLGDADFKHITEGLNFSKTSIMKGEGGKPIVDKGNIEIDR